MSTVAVIGGGWAGCAAAVQATRDGHQVTLFEAAREPGGRARSIGGAADGAGVLDNGQHILIGAYHDTLALMRLVGVDPQAVLLRQPLSLRFTDGGGLRMPDWPAPLDLLAGIASAQGWTLADRWSLLRCALRWQFSGYRCAPDVTVHALCSGMSPRVREDLIDPLCVSALNTPAPQAAGTVFLRVLRDSLFGPRGSSHLLLPKVDLGRLLPGPAMAWLSRHGARARLGRRVAQIEQTAQAWNVDGEGFERIVLATAPWDAERLVADCGVDARNWCAQVQALRYEAITTVYVQAPHGIAEPMLALRCASTAPAQFVFDRSRLGGHAGLLAFVVSASHGDRATLEAQVLEQAGQALGMQGLRVLQTVVEKRATLACTAGLTRPPMQVAPGLLACGDYVDGPYPSTLEGAVRSGQSAARAIGRPQVDPSNAQS